MPLRLCVSKATSELERGVRVGQMKMQQSLPCLPRSSCSSSINATWSVAKLYVVLRNLGKLVFESACGFLFSFRGGSVRAPNLVILEMFSININFVNFIVVLFWSTWKNSSYRYDLIVLLPLQHPFHMPASLAISPRVAFCFLKLVYFYCFIIYTYLHCILIIVSHHSCPSSFWIHPPPPHSCPLFVCLFVLF